MEQTTLDPVRTQATSCPPAPLPGPRTRTVLVHLAVSVLLAAAWLLAGPVSGPYRNHVAELVGLEAVWLLSSSVLVLTRSQRLEGAVGGVEAELWWHRLAGALGLVLGMVHPRLLVPVDGAQAGGEQHSVLAGLLNPLMLLGIVAVVWAAFLTPTSRTARRRGPLGWLARRGYDRWRQVHRLLAVFVVVSMVHGLVDSRTLLQSPGLLVMYAAVCAAGLYALVERFVLARRHRRTVEGSVVSAHRVGDRAVVLRVLPDRPLQHRVGQFVDLDVPASKEGPHPFTVVSTPDDPLVEVAVHVAGAGTARIVESVEVGDRVRFGAVRGLPEPAAPAGRELWVASGIGITPFVARLRDRAGGSGADDVAPVDLVWTRRGFADAAYLDELQDAARDLPWFTLHLRDTGRQDRVTPAELLAVAGGDPRDVTVLACGSPAAIRPVVAGLLALGVPHRALTTEAFGFR